MSSLQEIHDELKRLDMESYRRQQHVYLGRKQLRRLRNLLNQIKTGAQNNALDDFGRILSDGAPLGARIWALIRNCPEMRRETDGPPAGHGAKPTLEETRLPTGQELMLGAPAAPLAAQDQAKLRNLLQRQPIVREAHLPQIYIPPEEEAELALVLVVDAGASPQLLIEEIMTLLDHLPSLDGRSMCFLVKEDVDDVVKAARRYNCRLV